MRRAAALLIGSALLAAGCGSGDEEAPAPVERTEETAGQLPELPRGWERYESRAAGIIIGRPPGWAVAEDGRLTVLRAPDELVVLSVNVDRTDQALRVGTDEFATGTAKALPGFRKPLEPGAPAPFDHRYPGSVVRATGAARAGFTQRVRVVVLKREGAAVITAVLAENAAREAPAEVRQARRSLATLRTQPPR